MSESPHSRFEIIQRWGFHLHIAVVWGALLVFTFVTLDKGIRSVSLWFGLALAVHGILLLMFKTGLTRFEKLPAITRTGMLDELELSNYENDSHIIGFSPAMVVVGILSLLFLVVEVLFGGYITYGESHQILRFIQQRRSFDWEVLADILCLISVLSGTLSVIFTAMSFRLKAYALAPNIESTVSDLS